MGLPRLIRIGQMASSGSIPPTFMRLGLTAGITAKGDHRGFVFTPGIAGYRGGSLHAQHSVPHVRGGVAHETSLGM
jgi:hypothetical protein